MEMYPSQFTPDRSESNNPAVLSLALGILSLLICAAEISYWRLTSEIEQLFGNNNELMLAWGMLYIGLLALPLGLAGMFFAMKRTSKETRWMANTRLGLGAAGALVGIAWFYVFMIFALHIPM